MSSSTPAVYNFETLNVTRPKEFVVQVEVNRPDKRNAQNSTFYKFVLFCMLILLSLILGGGGVFRARFVMKHRQLLFDTVIF